jgi:hypothetical protein
VRQTLAAGLVGALAGAFLVLMAAPSDLFGRVPPPSGLIAAEPFRVAVVEQCTYDGTIHSAEMIVRAVF